MKMRPAYAIVPEGCEGYLTPGERLPITEIEKHTEYGRYFRCQHPKEGELYCLERHCAHLQDGEWIIVDEEGYPA